jgi:hypothetical protein
MIFIRSYGADRFRPLLFAGAKNQHVTIPYNRKGPEEPFLFLLDHGQPLRSTYRLLLQTGCYLLSFNTMSMVMAVATIAILLRSSA